MAAKPYAYCPGCDTRIRFNKRPTMGHKVTCPECLELLEVVELRPIELDWAFTDSMAGVSSDRNHIGDDDDFNSFDWEDNWQ